MRDATDTKQTIVYQRMLLKDTLEHVPLSWLILNGVCQEVDETIRFAGADHHRAIQDATQANNLWLASLSTAPVQEASTFASPQTASVKK